MDVLYGSLFLRIRIFLATHPYHRLILNESLIIIVNSINIVIFIHFFIKFRKNNFSIKALIAIACVLSAVSFLTARYIRTDYDIHGEQCACQVCKKHAVNNHETTLP